MHGDDHVGFRFLEFGDDLLQVIVGRRPEMKSTNDRMHLLDAYTSWACRTELTMPV